MRLEVHGKFFHLDGKPHFLRTVTYGPFPPDSPHKPSCDFARIREAGFDSIRVYSLPGQELLDQAAQHDLLVIPTHSWAQGFDFIAKPLLFQEAKTSLENWLKIYGKHPALGALLVGNEIPSDLARWMGALQVSKALDDLISSAKQAVPELPIGYANFPSTEYLEPSRADFTAFNIYLEDLHALRSYLFRLHHIAGDRPVYLTEFGMDTQHHPEEEQATLLPQGLRLAREAGLAGATIYAWSDHWFNRGEVITDWSFGLFRRDGTAKPVVNELRQLALNLPTSQTPPRFSVIICTRNGAARIRSCLAACRKIIYPNFEIIVVNDGSTDDTAEILDREEGIRVYHIEASGLSVARNFGAKMSTGEILAYTDDDCQPDVQWLSWLADAYAKTRHCAIGGPNLSPTPDSFALALTTAAPGAPTHVMLTDTLAEHLPGCHLSVRKTAFDDIGGFDPIFHTAGDDVDFCWRLRDAGYTLGFCGASFVWHHRRATIKQYLRQQIGYGHAEALLFKKHPHRFGENGIRWEGCVYQGGALAMRAGDFIYAGPTGEADYQSLSQNFVQPIRELHPKFSTTFSRLALQVLSSMQRSLRLWSRTKHGGLGKGDQDLPASELPMTSRCQFTLRSSVGKTRHHLYRQLLKHGWKASPQHEWDLCFQNIHLKAASEQTGTVNNHTFVALSSSDIPAALLTLACEAGFEIHAL